MKLGPGALVFAVCMAAQAAPFGVSIFNANYTASVAVGGFTNNVFGGDSRPMVAPFPISNTYNDLGPVEAYASADTFGISASTQNLWPPHPNALATATTELTFAPLTSGTASIGLDFFGANEWYYSDGYASLFDVTLNQTLWNYGWAYGSPSTVPWTNNYEGVAWKSHATVSVETDFSASDTYRLTMNTDTDANYDSQNVQIQLFGIQAAVPEPSTYALIGLGAATWLVLRRRRASPARPAR